MKGLIYRELYLSKKSYIAGFVTFLMIFLIGLLFRLSTEYGNLASLEGDAFRSVDIITYYESLYVPPAVMFFAMMAEHGIIIADFKSKWNIFSYTLPISEKKTAFVKYLILVCSMLAGLIFSILNALIICGISERPFTFGIVKNILIIMTCILINQSINIPLLMKLRSKAKSDIVFTIAFAMLLFAFSKFIKEIFTKIFSEFSDIENMSEAEVWELIGKFVQKIVDFRDKVFLFVPIAIIAVISAGYYASVRILKGREK
ncbi:MAG: ABC-2 transporter permease [Oscillospiraceae bacterium]|nr:ABC-2 transporter permease [Oscillospiraceae bacterium]